MKFPRIWTAVVILFAVILFSCSKRETATVNANGGLRMRAEPNLTAERIGTIPDGATVEILSRSGEEIELSGKTGKWTQVKYQNDSGWVFGGFLEDREAQGSSSRGEVDGKASSGTLTQETCRKTVESAFQEAGYLQHVLEWEAVKACLDAGIIRLEKQTLQSAQDCIAGSCRDTQGFDNEDCIFACHNKLIY